MMADTDTNTGRDEGGRFTNGHSGNPKGRPKKPLGEKLSEAIKRVEDDMGVNFLDSLIRRAFVDSSLALGLLRKLYPDLKSVENRIDDLRLAQAREDEQDFIDEALIRLEKEKQEAVGLLKNLDGAQDALVRDSNIPLTETTDNSPTIKPFSEGDSVKDPDDIEENYEPEIFEDD